MLIPGEIISIASFPGVIIHEFAHYTFCRIFKIPVRDVCFFRIGNPAGYVVHDIPENTFQEIMISVGPFLINSILGAIIGMCGAFAVMETKSPQIIDYIFFWLGVSIAMNAFPSTQDAKCIWQRITGEESFLAKLFGIPIVGLIYLGALASIIWLDVAYGVLVVLAIPKLITTLLI